MRSGKLDAEFRIVRADGQECWLAGKGNFIFDGKPDGNDTGTRGKPLRFMGVNFDITERKKAEEAAGRSSQAGPEHHRQHNGYCLCLRSGRALSDGEYRRRRVAQLHAGADDRKETARVHAQG